MPTPRVRTAWRVIAAAVLLAALAAAPLPVLAHADLTSSSPTADATLPASPDRITLVFSDDLKANSHFEVLDDAGTTITSGAPDPDVKDQMTATVTAALAPGLYEVRWTSVATDGDVERGTFAFTVAAATPAPPTPSPTPSDSAVASPSATPTPATSASPSVSPAPSPSGAGTPTAGGGDVVIPILAALILVGGLGIWLARRQRRV